MSSAPQPNDGPPVALSENRQIWAIAGPAIIANSSAPLVGLVDTWAIGHLPGAAYLAAVGVGATVFSYVFWAFGFMRMSTTGLVAQAHGRDDVDGLLKVVLRSLILGGLIAFCLIALQKLLFTASIAALAPPEGVATLYADYFNIRIWSAPAVLFTYGISGYLIGVAKARAALVLQLVLNITNGGLNLLFVIGFGLGVKGIALGSLIAEWTAAIVGIGMLISHFGGKPLRQALVDAALWRIKHFAGLAQTNGYIFVRTLLLMTALTLVTREAGLISESALAASHIMTVFMLLISLGLDAFAYAVEALAGAAYGKGVRDKFKRWVKLTSLWALLAACLYSIVFYVFGSAVITGLTDVVSVQNVALETLPIIVWLPLASVACYQFDGIFIGATAAGAMMTTMLASFLIFMAIIGPLTAALGLKGLWLAVIIFSACRGLTQWVYYPFIIKKLG